MRFNVEKFSKRIRELRLEKQWSMKYLGELIGVSESYVGHLENARRNNPSVDLIDKLATLFNVDAAYLRGETDHKHASKLLDKTAKLLDRLVELGLIEKDEDGLINEERLDELIESFNLMFKKKEEE